MTDPYWSKSVRDRWFFAALTMATLALGVLLWPYLYVLLFAVVVVVVTWPLFERALTLLRGRRGAAAVLTTAGLLVVVFGPLATLAGFFVSEGLAFVQQAVRFVQDGGLEGLISRYTDEWEPMVDAWLGQYVAEDFDLLKQISGPVQSGVLSVLEATGSLLPSLVVGTANTLFDAVIFLFAVVTLYMEGPAVTTVLKRLSPMDDAYEDHLFEVFREFSTNMVIGSLATAVLQGIVAGIGYLVAGVPSVVLFAIATAIGSFVPFVGTLVVWVPLSVYTYVNHGLGWALFLAIWSMVLTGSVDNLAKPLFLRGSTSIHPLLIFLGVFGGIAWMGVPGALVGPVVVAFFLALYHIYVHDFLGVPRPEPPPPTPALLDRLRARFRPAPKPTEEDVPTDPGVAPPSVEVAEEPQQVQVD